MPCRCGWDGVDAHLCHRCHARPGTRRFYTPHMKFSLAGAQLKFSVAETYACDECWKQFTDEVHAKKAEWENAT